MSCINQSARNLDDHLHCNIVVATHSNCCNCNDTCNKKTPLTAAIAVAEVAQQQHQHIASRQQNKHALNVRKFISPFPVGEPKTSHRNIQAV